MSAVMAAGKEYYDGVYNIKPIRYFKRYDAVYQTIMKHINKNDIVLDLGCGMGYFDAVYLNGNCKDFLGVDFSVVGIQKAQQCFPLLNNKFRIFDIMNMDKLEFAHTVIVCSEVLEHIDTDIELISKIRSGILFIFTVPANENEMKLSKSHLRSYTEKDIHIRYGNLLDIQNITPVGQWFVVKSTRKV